MLGGSGEGAREGWRRGGAVRVSGGDGVVVICPAFGLWLSNDSSHSPNAYDDMVCAIMHCNGDALRTKFHGYDVP